MELEDIQKVQELTDVLAEYIVSQKRQLELINEALLEYLNFLQDELTKLKEETNVGLEQLQKH